MIGYAIRVGAAVILVWFAIYGLEAKQKATPVPDSQVLPVADVLRNASHVDRCVWAEVWEKAAKVAEGDGVGEKAIFTDTRSLRFFTVISLDVAWNRIAGNQPGKYPGLREAVEKYMAEAIGLDDVPVTPDLLRRYVEAARALAWCGVGRG